MPYFQNFKIIKIYPLFFSDAHSLFYSALPFEKPALCFLYNKVCHEEKSKSSIGFFQAKLIQSSLPRERLYSNL